jgi:hypothetical protein
MREKAVVVPPKTDVNRLAFNLLREQLPVIKTTPRWRETVLAKIAELGGRGEMSIGHGAVNAINESTRLLLHVPCRIPVGHVEVVVDVVGQTLAGRVAELLRASHQAATQV